MSRKILFTLKGHIDSITSIAVSSNGKIAISASVDCTLKVWNLQQGILLHNLEGHNRTIESVAMTPDGRRGVSASADGTLKVWDLERGIELSTLRGHGRAVSSVAITPDGRRAISGAIDGVVKIWDLETVENLSVLSQDKFYDSHHKNAVSSLVVTPDRELAISVSVDETMTIWLLEKAVPILTYQCPCDGLPIDRGLLRSLHAALVSPIPHHGLTSVAITPDMRYIVAASADKRLKVIELSHRLDFVDLITKSISTKWHFLTGHQDLVWTVAVTPDGRRAISGSDDRTIKIWDLKQCKELYTLEGHSDRIIAIVVTPDGRYMISATTSRVYTWNLRSKRIVSTFNIKDNEEVITVVTTTTKGPYVISQTTGHSLNVWHLESQNHVCTLSHLHRINGSALLDTAEYLISVSDDGI